MKEKKVKVEPDLGAIPQTKTTYWYIRSGYYKPFAFDLFEEVWCGSISDLYRLAKGNVYLDRKEAEKTLDILNSRLEKLRLQAVEARLKECLAEEEAKSEVETSGHKALHEKKKKHLTVKEKAEQYENNKKKRVARNKSPHPDIIS